MISSVMFASYSQLAEAAYATLNGEDEAIQGDVLRDLLKDSTFGPSEGWSHELAVDFVKHWRVVSHQPNTASGFSATLYEQLDNGVPSGKLVLATRGTEPKVNGEWNLTDIAEDAGNLAANGLAWEQIVDLYNYWQRISTPTTRPRLQAAISELYRVPIGTPLPVATALLAAKVAALSLSGRSDFVVESDRIVAITVRHSAENGLGKVPAETGFYDVIDGSASGDLIAGHSRSRTWKAAFCRIFGRRAQPMSLEGRGGTRGVRFLTLVAPAAIRSSSAALALLATASVGLAGTLSVRADAGNEPATARAAEYVFQNGRVGKGHSFCEAIRKALNATRPTSLAQPCVESTIRGVPGVSEPSRQELDLATHEVLFKQVRQYAAVPGWDYRIATYEGGERKTRYWLSDAALDREYREAMTRGDRLVVWQQPVSSQFGEKVLLSWIREGMTCGKPSGETGRAVVSVLFTPDLARVYSGPGADRKHSFPLIYGGQVYVVDPVDLEYGVEIGNTLSEGYPVACSIYLRQVR